MKRKSSSTRKPTSPRRSSRSPSKTLKVREPEVLPAEESDLDQDVEAPVEEGDLEFEESENPDASQMPATIELTDSDLRAVSPTDPLRRFIEELRRYPLMSPEEEFKLATHLKSTGDIEAARRLVSANLRLVVKIAFEYRSMYSNVMDLIQEGNIGLMKAVSKFDPTKGARLGYYASWWIRSYILKYLLDNFRLIKIGTTQAQKKLFYHLMREKERLENQGLLAGPKLLAEKLNVREKDVIEMEQRLSGRGAELSLNAPVSSDEDGDALSHLNLIPDEQEGADHRLERDQLIQILKGKLPEFKKSLNTKELRILEDRLLAEEPKTLQEVAALYGLTRERARQIEAKMILKLRDFLALGQP